MTKIILDVAEFARANLPAGQFLFLPSVEDRSFGPRDGRNPRRVRHLTVALFGAKDPFLLLLDRHADSAHLRLDSELFDQLHAELTAATDRKEPIELTLEIGDNKRLNLLRINSVEVSPGTRRHTLAPPEDLEPADAKTG